MAQNWNLEDLKLAFAAMNPGTAAVLQNVGDAAQHFPHGYRTQWMGLDPQGKPRGALYSDWDAPKSEWVWNSEAQMLLPPTRSVRPGIVDETLALPAFFGYEGSETVNEASQRVQELDDALRAQYGTPLPESWGDYFGEAGGIMGAQIPMPAGGGKSLAGALGRYGKYVPEVVRRVGRSRPVRIAKGILGSVPEWFMPTIEPTPQNYAFGTAAGTLLTKYLPEIVGSSEEAAPQLPSEEEDIYLEDPEKVRNPLTMNRIYRDVQEGTLDPDAAAYLLEKLLTESGRLEPEETGYAKGGKVKPPSTMELRKRIAELMSEAGVEGTGKEMIPVDPNLPAQDINLPEAEIEVPSETNQPSILDTPVSRRSVLQGMRDLAGMAVSPVDPTSLILKELETSVAPAAVRAVKTFTPVQMANKLSGIWETMFGMSDDNVDDLLLAMKEAEEIPGSEGLIRQIGLAHKTLTELADADLAQGWPPGDSRYDEYSKIYRDLHQNTQEEMEKIARDHGVVALTDRWEDMGSPESGPGPLTAVDPVFAEPPEGGQQILDDTISSYQSMGEDMRPEDWKTLNDLKKLRDYLGPRADAALSEYWLTGRPLSGPKYQLEEAFEKLNIDPDILEAIADAAESHYVQWGTLDDWVSADPELRQKYRDLRDRLADIAEKHPYDSPPEERDLMQEYHENWNELFPNSIIHEDSGTAYEAEVRARRILNDLKLDDEEFAKGGRISLKKLRESVGGGRHPASYPINPAEKIDPIVLDQSGGMVDGWKRLGGLELYAERHGLDPARVKVPIRREEYAKGGKVKPPSGDALRQQLKELVAQAEGSEELPPIKPPARKVAYIFPRYQTPSEGFTEQEYLDQIIGPIRQKIAESGLDPSIFDQLETMHSYGLDFNGGESLDVWKMEGPSDVVDQLVKRGLASDSLEGVRSELPDSPESQKLLDELRSEFSPKRGHAKGGRIIHPPKLRERLEEEYFHAKANLEDTKPILLSMGAESRLKEMEAEVERLGQMLDRLNKSERGMAKGGKVITDLRRKLAELIAPAEEAGVEGTGQEIVPVPRERFDPATGEPLESPEITLEQIQQRIAAPREEPRGTVSRRDILQGLAGLASPVKLDPLALLGRELENLGQASASGVAKTVEPVMGVVARVNDREGWERAAWGPTAADAWRNLVNKLAEGLPARRAQGEKNLSEFEDIDQIFDTLNEFGIDYHRAPNTVNTEWETADPIDQEMVFIRGEQAHRRSRFEPELSPEELSPRLRESFATDESETLPEDFHDRVLERVREEKANELIYDPEDLEASPKVYQALREIQETPSDEFGNELIDDRRDYDIEDLRQAYDLSWAEAAELRWLLEGSFRGPTE